MKRPFIRSTAAFLAVGVVLAALRAALVVNHIEKNAFDSSAYTLPDSAPFRLFAVLAALYCVAAAVFGIAKSPRGRVCRPEHSAPAPTAAAFAVALALIVQAAMFVVYCAENKMQPTADNIIQAAFALAASLLFFLPLGVRFIGGAKAPLPLFTAFVPVLYCCARLIVDFVRTNAAPMESSNAYHILSLVALLMLVTAESASRMRQVAPFRFLAFGYTAAAFLLVYAAPNLVLPAFGLLEFDYLTIVSVGDICLAFYCAARVSTCVTEKAPKTPGNGKKGGKPAETEQAEENGGSPRE